MSFKCDFKVAGNSYEVIQCQVSLYQKYDPKGKPASGVHAGSIRIILNGTDDGALGSWMADSTKKQDGKIVFYTIDQEGTRFKEVDFEGAYLVTLIESFSVDNQLLRSIMVESDFTSTDAGPKDDEDAVILKKAVHSVFDCQTRTGRSYCMLLRVSAEKITIDGVEHQN